MTPECHDEVCITCSDEARLGEVVAATVPDVATVRTAAGAEAVVTTLVGPLEAGDLVLIHAGTAIERLGARLDGVLRAHTPAYDGAGIRDTASYSILAGEWPELKAELQRKLTR